MRGHGQLRKMSFSQSVRQISGDLTPAELLVFFNRIEKAGKVSYSRKRFQSFPAAQPIPFVMKIKRTPMIAEQQSTKPGSTPALPASAPTQTAR